MKSNNNMNEFLTNNDKYIDKYIDIIERYIFFEDVWLFPEKKPLNNFLVDKLPDSYFKIADIIVSEMNNMNIDPETYNKNIFNDILKNI